ncbi:MAG TPA: ATP-binding protein [Rhizomicrobium sp.]|jgi:signal transduction histidine kinase
MSDARAGTRWIPFAAIAAAALLLVLGIGLALYEDRFAGQQHRQEITEQANILAASVTAAVEFADHRAATAYINALKVNPEILSAAVYDAHGRMLAELVRSGARRPPATAANDSEARSGKARIRLLEPVLQKAVQIGSVYLSATGESLQIRIARFVVIALLGAMGALVMVVLAAGQFALGKANAELGRRAADLTRMNARLQTEMEERRHAEEALLQTQKLEAIAQLSGGIAHDLNNFFSVIKGNLQLMRRRLAQGRFEVQGYIDSAEEGLDKATGLTRRILAFARRQPLLTERVDLGRLVANMLGLIGGSVGNRIAVETDLASRWYTRCDPGQIEAILLNLAINARDAMPQGGNFRISTRDRTIADGADESLKPGEYVELSVRDTGLGMTEEVRRRALEPFFTTKPPGQGTGLGLSTAFSYIGQSGGRLSVESSPGKGTRIVILLPHEVAAAPVANEKVE